MKEPGEMLFDAIHEWRERAITAEEEIKRLRKELSLWRARFEMYKFDGKQIVPRRYRATGLKR